MTRLAVEADADDLSRRGFARPEYRTQGLRSQMRLISERDDEMGQRNVTERLLRRRHDRAHHAPLRREGRGALPGRKPQAVQFERDGGFTGAMHHENFFHSGLAPLGEDMPEDGRLAPGQTELR